ncbi:hypothetical protein EJA72_16875 [Pseudomonas sp. PB120]|uniref:hypothetical protein n=1 Tax=Pseudomonas sp. PB120 TaxID=2494700 RepID=UPI0012FD1FED|nr:hypothetical protein [Pseudomonas sp. PB120]MVV49897.1 hypothetical protein [Pseudomonas sp. PB120]
MDDMTELDNFILRLAKGGIASGALRREVMSAHPGLRDSHYFSALLSLQDRGRLAGQDITGVWVFTSFDEEHRHDDQACSPAFAEMIIATDCADKWHEIDVDEMIAELDLMIQKARARKSP